MSDIFREIDQEVRREQALKLWAKYQIPILAVGVLIIAATAGWRLWETRRQSAAEAAGVRYEAAIKLAQDGKSQDALSAFQAIAKAGPSGYALLATLRAANEEAAHDPAAAVKAYDAIAQDSAAQEPIQDAAKLRAALLRVDAADPQEISRRLDPLAAPGNPYHASARELLAIVALKHKDYEAAARWLDMIVTDPGAPSGARATAEALLGLVAGAPRPPSPAAPQPAPAPVAANPAAKPAPAPLKPAASPSPPAKPAAAPGSP